MHHDISEWLANKQLEIRRTITDPLIVNNYLQIAETAAMSYDRRNPDIVNTSTLDSMYQLVLNTYLD